MSRVPTKLLLELTPTLAERLQEASDARGGTKMGIVRLALEIYLRQLDVTESQHFVVNLPLSTAETVAAFREIRNYPDREKLIEAALLAHIDQECKEDKSLRPRLEEAKTVQVRKRIHTIKETRAEGE